MRSGRNTSNILRSINPVTEDEIEGLSQQLRLRVLLWLLNHDNSMLRKTITTEALCWFDRVHIKRKEMEGSDSARIAKQNKQAIIDKPWKSVHVSFKHAL